VARPVLLLALLAAVLLAGCAHEEEKVRIAPLAPAAGRVDPGLGPGTRALSSGPGYKGSPGWNPDGSRISFTVDGYVVDRPTASVQPRRRTTKDFVATDAEWTSGDTLMILGAAPASRPKPGAESSLYKATAERDALELRRVAKGVLAMSPGEKGLTFALKSGAHESSLALALGSGEIYGLYAGSRIEGRVAALSLSPDGDEAVMALRPPDDRDTSGLRTFDLGEGTGREVARLGGDQEILGTPQWTEQGLYFVAGKQTTSVDADGAEPLYKLYRVPSSAGAPELAPGVGEDFVASSIRVSPDGKRLAVIGRLNPKSPPNLYVLDPAAQKLTAVTTNEDMEIKTGPDDLAWSPDGKNVAIIARGTPSTEPEVRQEPAGTLLRDFYNLYEIPVPEGR
jgi:Tol biopolymer transport system component